MCPRPSGNPPDAPAEASFEFGAVTSNRMLPAGLSIGPYVIEACIGEGAMARVYRARHRGLNKLIALKVLAPELVADAEARRRFLAEVQACSAIHHPNVVAVLDASVVDELPYLAMELLDGENLAQHLERRGSLTVEQSVGIALPLLDGLMAAHQAGVIHRDIKPANMFLARGADGQIIPKLLDFGVSKVEDPLRPWGVEATKLNELVGSPLYFPPEVRRGAHALTERSDQYSFGVVLYECITGQVPFAETELLPLLEAISLGACVGPCTLVPSVPQRLEAVILRAMSVEPAERFDHVRDLASALREVALARWQEATSVESGASRAAWQSSAAPMLAASAAGANAARSSSRPARAKPRRARAMGTWWRALPGALGVVVSVSAIVVGSRPPTVVPVAPAVVGAGSPGPCRAPVAEVPPPSLHPAPARAAAATSAERARDGDRVAREADARAVPGVPTEAPPLR